MRHSKNGRKARFAGRLGISAAVFAALCSTVLTDAAVAGPDGARVRRGDVTIIQRGNRTIIRAADGSIINFRNFNIGRDEIVRFIQPGEWARVLNRITGDAPTIIDGTLRANGQVYIVNPAGVFFTGNSVVNVGGLYAAAGNISDRRFLAGIDRFNDLSGDVVNEGVIFGDAVYLIGDHAANHGSIQSGGGVVAMLAGDDVLIRRHGEQITIRIDGERLSDQRFPSQGETAPDPEADPGVLNSGTIDAREGQVMLGAGDLYALGIHNRGTIRAAAGQITVAASDGLVHNEGLISASTPRGQAGSVVVQGPSVVNAGRIEADADHGSAGSVEVTSRDHTYLMPGSRVSASGGSGQADGGDILIHSYDGLTVQALGSTVDASGGRLGGDGGFAEISGEELIFTGGANLNGRNGGADGVLLLDPRDITIADVGSHDGFLADGYISFLEGGELVDISISDEALESVIGLIWLQALRDLVIAKRVDLVNNNDIILQAYRHIRVNRGILGANDFNLLADADNNGIGNLYINTPITGITGTAIFDGQRIFLNAGSIVSNGQQIYSGPVTLGTHAALGTPLARFKLTLDGTNAGAEPLIVSGDVFFGGRVGGVVPLQSITVFGTTTFDTDLVSTTDFQRYFGPALLLKDLTLMNGGEASFLDAVDGIQPGQQSLHILGDARFDGAVGATNSLESIEIDGATQMNAGLVRTAGDQLYHGPVIVGADSHLLSTGVFGPQGGGGGGGGGDILFFSPVEGPAGLHVTTAGLTRFFDTVGAATPLAFVLTDGGGDTLLGGDTFATTIDFQDLVRLTDSISVTGFDSASFQAIRGAGHDLFVVSPDTTFGGAVTGVGLLETDAAGTTRLAGGLIDANTIRLGDAVILVVDNTLRANDFVDFGSTVDGQNALRIRAGGEVFFGGDVGGSDALASLEVTAGDVITIDANLIRALGNIELDGGNDLGGPAVATIAGTGGDLQIRSLNGRFVMGEGDRMSVLGDLLIDAGELAILGDLSTLGDMVVKAPKIIILTRGRSRVLQSDGSFARDFGVDFVSGGLMRFSTAPRIRGEGEVIFATASGRRFGASLDGFARSEYGEVTLSDLLLGKGELVLDLVASRPAPEPEPEPEPEPDDGDDLAEAFAEGADLDRGPVADRVLLDPLVRRNLERMGIIVRDLADAELVETTRRGSVFNDTTNVAILAPDAPPPATAVHRLYRPIVVDALDRFAAMFYGVESGIDADFATLEDRSGAIRTAIASAHSGYQGGASGFRAHLQAQGNEVALNYLDALEAILNDIDASGLAHAEIERSRRAILDPVAPPGVGYQEMIELIRGGVVTMR